MKNTTALMITALAAAAAFSPLTAEAAERNFSAVKVPVSANSPILDHIKEKLPSEGWNSESFSWGTVLWNDYCPTPPGGGGNSGNDGSGNGGNTELPDNGGNQNPDDGNPGGGNQDPETPDQDTPGNGGNTELPDSGETETPGSGTENTPGEDNDSDSAQTFAKRVVSLVNVERAKEGLGALSIDSAMEQAATVRAQEIQTSFAHTRPNGTGYFTALTEAGVDYRASGENIAWGQKTPEEVVHVWMNSPSHRANIMNRNFSRIGVGHLQNGNGVSYWVQLFAN